MKVILLATLAMVLAPSAAHAQERLSWRLGEPQAIWSNVTPSGQGRYRDRACFGGPMLPQGGDPRPRSTIAPHPRGGVVVVTHRSASELMISRVNSRGRLLWQTPAIVNVARGEPAPYAHIDLGDARSPAPIISVSYSLLGLHSGGALHWQRAPSEFGFIQFGMIRRVRDGLLIGGWGLRAVDDLSAAARREARDTPNVPPEGIAESADLGDFYPRVAAAEVSLWGETIWSTRFPPLEARPSARRGYPPPADEAPERRSRRLTEEDISPDWYLQTVSLPLRPLDQHVVARDGELPRSREGSLFLIGCGRVGASVPSPSSDLAHLRPPCHASQSARLAVIDGDGRLRDHALIGEPLNIDPPARAGLPRHVFIDAPLHECALHDSDLPSVLWLGDGSAAIRDLLTRTGFWNAGEGYIAYGPAYLTWLHVPVLDAVTFEGRDYLLFGHLYESSDGSPRARRRLRVLLVRMDAGVPTVLIDRSMSPMLRLRLALGESALYGLSGDHTNRVLRFAIRRSRR